MEPWKLLIITILSAIVIGCVAGVAIGKHQVKKAMGTHKPLLTVRERIIYSVCLGLGAGMILFGLFFKFPGSNNQALDPGGMVFDNGMLNPGELDPGIIDDAENGIPGANDESAATDGTDGVINLDENSEEAGEVSEDSGESVETDEPAVTQPVGRPAMLR